MSEQSAGRYHSAPYTLDERAELPDDAEAQPLSAGHDEADAEAVREKIEAHKENAKEQLEQQADRDREFAERDPKPTPSQMLQESGREPAPDTDEQTSSTGSSGAGSEDTADDSDCPPNGSVQDVLDWVGDDKARAQQALDAEKAGQNRTTLIAELEKRAA